MAQPFTSTGSPLAAEISPLRELFVAVHARRRDNHARGNGENCSSRCLLLPSEMEAARQAIKTGADLDASLTDRLWGDEAHTPLALAIELGDFDLASLFLDANPSRPDVRAFSLLCTGAAPPPLSVAKKMHARGFPVEQLTDGKKSLLPRFVSQLDVEAVKWMLALGADPDASHPVNPSRGQNGFFHLVHHIPREGAGADAQIAQLLADAGANLHARDREGATPLHWAFGLGRLRLARKYLEMGAALDARDDEGATPLGWLADAKKGQDPASGRMWPDAVVAFEGVQNERHLHDRLAALPAQLEAETLRLELSRAGAKQTSPSVSKSVSRL